MHTEETYIQRAIHIEGICKRMDVYIKRHIRGGNIQIMK